MESGRHFETVSPSILRSLFREKRLNLAVGLAPVVAIVAIVGASAAAPISSTVIHPLGFTKYTNVVLSQQDATNALSLGSRVLNQCTAVFEQRGAIASSSTIPSVVNSAQDMARACGSSHIAAENGFEPLGAPRKVRYVNAINWCGGPGSNIIGCAYTPGTCMVVVRVPSSLEGNLLAHEFGHSKGLPHRTDVTTAVMYPSIGADHTQFNSNECSAIRQLSLYARTGPPQSSFRLAKIPIVEFVQQLYPHGVPYDLAREYGASEVGQIRPWLRDASQAGYWANVASVIGIVATGNAYDDLRALVLSAGSGSLPIDQYNGRRAALMSLGYVVRGNGSADARTFLEQHSNPSSWGTVAWLAPYHQNADERNAELAQTAILALSLIGDERATAFLERLRRQRFPNVTRAVQARMEEVIDQAVADSIIGERLLGG